MPAKQSRVPGSVAEQIESFLRANPDYEYRAHAIATELGLPTHPVANECGRMSRRGEIHRERMTVEGRVQPVAYYRSI